MQSRSDCRALAKNSIVLGPAYQSSSSTPELSVPSAASAPEGLPIRLNGAAVFLRMAIDGSVEPDQPHLVMEAGTGRTTSKRGGQTPSVTLVAANFLRQVDHAT